jgi:hypothetical protein
MTIIGETIVGTETDPMPFSLAGGVPPGRYLLYNFWRSDVATIVKPKGALEFIAGRVRSA